ncbi:acyl-coenzyme A synthetase/AMP-(fatty) acid ligase [Geofilum rubicundum JCM 15548]|uniref:Acyl-coenzyme A synthetase/AMP-(Fatty) acid ligase n=2 Tax=Geofilum TaxID=1236988 RepID=A0A0E9LWM9_9BACT|nr:acyl-coenzyme A synthetase/AMP-(fatty) acid ligase [Geofilum rubicundum JCM 15548]
MGIPVPLYDIDLLKPDGTPCEDGEQGQIVIRVGKQSPQGLFKGYYRDEARTREVWQNGIYYTGDIAWRDEDGYYWFVGRVDDVIKSSGYRIGPFEVESALMTHPAVVECAVTGAPDEIRGQVVKATIVLAADQAPSEALKQEIQDHVKKITAPYKYPRLIDFVKELPKTISGKIRRVEIRGEEKSDRP